MDFLFIVLFSLLCNSKIINFDGAIDIKNMLKQYDGLIEFDSL